MRGIAAEAGVTGMAIYNYVDSKGALFEAVWRQSINTIYADYADAVASASPALSDEIEAVLDRTRDILLADPDHLRLAARLLLEREHPDLAELDLGTGAHIDFLQGLGGRAVARGELTEAEAGQLSAFVLTLLWGITAMTSLDPPALDITLDAARWAIHNKIASAQEAPTT